MGRDRTLSWLYQLDRGVQAVLLANPHGFLPAGVAADISDHTVVAHRNESPRKPVQWQLRSAEANLLEDERLRLDQWWKDLPDSTRVALVACRTGEIPQEYREALLDVIPGGVPAGTDLDSAFDMSGIAVAYVEMVAVNSPSDVDAAPQQAQSPR